MKAFIKSCMKCSSVNILNMKISAIVITKNEEKNIRECLDSLKWADEIVVVDSNSEDKSREIASSYTTRVFNIDDESVTNKWKHALKMAFNNWVLMIAADERVTPELQNEILHLEEPGKYNGYYINRKNYYLGKWIKHSGLYPDFSIRLFKKDSSAIIDRVVHEAVEVKGECSRLNENILHFTSRNVEDIIKKANYFSSLEAEENFARNKKITKIGVYTHGISAFLRMYISRKGFMDGMEGFLVGFSYAFVNFLSHLKLLKLRGKL